MTTLAILNKGERGIISTYLNNDLSTKLIDMGCIPGERFSITNIAPLGCPISIDVQGYQLSIRKSEAENVLVEREK